MAISHGKQWNTVPCPLPTWWLLSPFQRILDRMIAVGIHKATRAAGQPKGSRDLQESLDVPRSGHIERDFWSIAASQPCFWGDRFVSDQSEESKL